MDLDEKLRDVYKVVGPNLQKVLDAYFPKDKEELVGWVHTPNELLGKTPYEFCKEGKQQELESMLIILAQGNIGS